MQKRIAEGRADESMPDTLEHGGTLYLVADTICCREASGLLYVVEVLGSETEARERWEKIKAHDPG